jgi:recombination protein RecT
MTNDIKVYIRSDEIKARFAEIMGDRDAAAYISSVMLAVANSEGLQECTPKSIVICALRAATMRLSCDPAMKQAQLVPFGNKATLIIHYKGLVDMAIRTNKYRYINVYPIEEGIAVAENPYSGLHTLTGFAKSKQVIGYLAAFEMMNGFGKTLYMTLEEIHQHAQKFSKSYNNPKGSWKTNTASMERKTPLRLLLQNWGYLDPYDAAVLKADDNGIVDDPLPSEEKIDEELDSLEMLEESELQPEKETEADVKPKRTAEENIQALFPEANHDEKQDAAKSEPIKGPAQILQTLVARGLAENIPAASTIVNSLGLVGKKGDLVIRQVQIYRGWRDTGLSSPEAFAKTLGGMIPD